MKNRHPVDELAEIRAEMRKLDERERELRSVIIEGSCGLQGDEFEANVSKTCSTRLDTAAVRKALGDEKLAPYLKPSEVMTVKVKPIDRSYLADADAA